MKRVVTYAILAVTTAVASSAFGAEPAASNRASGGPERDALVVLDNNSLWHHFLVSRCAYERGADGTLEPWDVVPLGKSRRNGIWCSVAPRPAASTAPSPLPPADWAGLAMDDSAWPRVRLPQPVPTITGYGIRVHGGGRPQVREGGTAVLLVRGRFEVKNPAEVTSCRLDLEYWGGVVVHVNGKEVVRGHVLSGKRGQSPFAGTARRVLRTNGDCPLVPDEPDLLALAEDYPVEAFTTPEGKPLRYAGDYVHQITPAQRISARDKPLRYVGDDVPAMRGDDPLETKEEKIRARLALRYRHLRDVHIPAALLRQGVNVLAIEVHTAPAYVKRLKDTDSTVWPPIGLLSAQLTVSPAGAAVANVARPRAIQVWNCAAYDTVTAFDYGDPWELLRPIVIRAARNGVFSGRLMVGSDRAIEGLQVNVSDLGRQKGSDAFSQPDAGGGAKLSASAVRVRCAVPAAPGKSWVAPCRFDGLLDGIPAEIPVIEASPRNEKFHGRSVDRKALLPGAVAPLWFTVRVPKDAGPGVYEGTVSVAAEGLRPTDVPLRVSVCDWTVPDAKDFRMHNMAYHSDEAVARHYAVPRWSEKHFELIGKSHALMAEAGSRQVYANLCVDALVDGSNPESLVRWIKRPDGSYTHDFTVFDKYLDVVAKSVGKPLPLRLNCWNSFWGPLTVGWVSVLDPATGKIERLRQPDPGTAEAVEFWRPVFDEVLKKLRARGWLDVAAFGWLNARGGPPNNIAKLAQQLWPNGVWAIVNHDVTRDWRDGNNPWVKTVYANTVYYYGVPSVRGYRELLTPQPGFFCNAYRWCWSENSVLTDQRRVGEDIVMSGRDGISDFGADLFPVKNPRGRCCCVPHCEWPAGPGVSQLALLYPAPDGPVATERFEMFREGVELAEALLFIEQAIQEKKLRAELQQRVERALEARSHAFIMNWFIIRDMPGAEEDAKLLDVAGEVAKEVQKNAK